MKLENIQFGALVGFRIFLAILIVGLLSKTIHWPYDSIQIIVGSIGLLLLYSLRTVLKEKRNIVDWVKLIFLSFFSIRAIFITQHLPIPKVVLWTISTIQFLALIYLLFNEAFILFPQSRKRKWSFPLTGIISAVILIGAMYKIMHWPGATVLLTIGGFLTAIWIVVDPFLIKKFYLLQSSMPKTLDEELTEDSPVESTNISSLKGRKYYWLFITTGLVMIAGLLFRFLNWPGAGTLIIISLALGAIYLLLTAKR